MKERYDGQKQCIVMRYFLRLQILLNLLVVIVVLFANIKWNLKKKSLQKM